MASPILPAPRMAIVVMAIRVPRRRPASESADRSISAATPSRISSSPKSSVVRRLTEHSGDTAPPPARPGSRSESRTGPSPRPAPAPGWSTIRDRMSPLLFPARPGRPASAPCLPTWVSTRVSTLSISMSVSPMPSSGRSSASYLRLMLRAEHRSARHHLQQPGMPQVQVPVLPGDEPQRRPPAAGLGRRVRRGRRRAWPHVASIISSIKRRLAGDVGVERHRSDAEPLRRRPASTARRRRRHRPARWPRRRSPAPSARSGPAGPAVPRAAQGCAPGSSAPVRSAFSRSREHSPGSSSLSASVRCTVQCTAGVTTSRRTGMPPDDEGFSARHRSPGTAQALPALP